MKNNAARTQKAASVSDALNNNKKRLLLIAGLFLSCALVKDLEFLVWKTDRTVLAENIFCKLFAIAMIFFCLHRLRLTWKDLGFVRKGLFKGAALGIGLGTVTFFFSYLTEYLILLGRGLHPRLSLYIANFTLSEQNVTGVTLSALLICLFGNVINVWAEEGLFRGLFLTLFASMYRHRTANLMQAVLFGLWHLVVIGVWVQEGSLPLSAAPLMGLGYVALAAILGYEWGLCAALTGTVWAGASEHFFNNFISNALHMVTETGTDELQVVRIVLSNVLSLLTVVALTGLRNRRQGTVKTQA